MKKAIKKIVALGIGASMLGATILGAAADLNDYPSPFVSGGQFSGTLVVGDSAAAEDVIGVSDIAMSLQFASSVKAGGKGAGATTTIEGDAWRVSESGDDLNLFQNLSTVTNIIDDNDLSALASGTLRAKNVADYSQELTLPSIAVEFVVDDDAEVEDPALFLKFPSGINAVNYELSFTTPAESEVDGTNLEDFDDERITILGREYTITKALNDSSNAIELTLMSGAVQDTLEVGQTKTYNINGKDYETTVMVVSGDASSTAITKLIVNDEVTSSLSKDDTFTLKDGTEIGIKEVLPTKTGDSVQNLVELFIGAEKLVFDAANSQLEVREETLNDVTAAVTTTYVSGEQRLEKIEIDWTPTDDYFVPIGGRLSEVVDDDDDYIIFLETFGIDYQFAGLEASQTEVLRFYPSGRNNYKIQYVNRDGVEYDEKIFFYNSSITVPSTTGPRVSLGDDATHQLFVVEGETVCDNDMFVTEFNKHSRIFELTDVSANDRTFSLKDKGTGKTTEHSYNSGANPLGTFTFDGANFQVNVTDTVNKCVDLINIAADSADTRADIWTQYDTKVAIYGGQLNQSGGAANIVITEDEDGRDDDQATENVYLNFSYDTTDAEIRLSVGTFSAQETASGPGQTDVLVNLDSDDNTNEGYTQWGNFVRQSNTDDQDKWEFWITEDEAVAEVYVTAGVTKVSRSDSVSGEAVILQRIDVGATKLASEVAGLERSQNLLLVGGPCANAAVTSASASFPTCGDWPLSPGEALIQLVEQADGHVALLVAGSTAADTRAATSVVADMTDLQDLADGVMTQVLTVSTGTLMDWEAPSMEDEDTDDMEAEE